MSGHHVKVSKQHFVLPPCTFMLHSMERNFTWEPPKLDNSFTCRSSNSTTKHIYWIEFFFPLPFFSQRSANVDDDEDPFDARIRKSGCATFHYALQDCFDEKRDWRVRNIHQLPSPPPLPPPSPVSSWRVARSTWIAMSHAFFVPVDERTSISLPVSTCKLCKHEALHRYCAPSLLLKAPLACSSHQNPSICLSTHFINSNTASPRVCRNHNRAVREGRHARSSQRHFKSAWWSSKSSRMLAKRPQEAKLEQKLTSESRRT